MFKLATFRGVSADGEPLAQVFRPGDSIRKLAGTMMPEIQEWLGAYKAQDGKIAVLVNAMGASEFWGQNINGDIFPESALIHDCRDHPSEHHPVDDFSGKTVPAYGYWTFLNAHPFVHHQNKDPSRAFGKVVLACWNPYMRRVELVVLLDKQLAMQHGAQHVIDRILAGEFPDVSMGCKVPYDICTICQHKSKTRKDYCNCIRYIGMGKILDDGRRIGVINTYPRFFDISFVFIGADKTAKVMCKLASSDLWVPQSVAEGEWLYGADNDGGVELVKAASVQVPGNFLYLSTDKTAGILMPPAQKLYMSKEDPQDNHTNKRAVGDGALKTNSNKNETDEFPDTSATGSREGEDEDEVPYRPGRADTDRRPPDVKNRIDRPAEEAKVAAELQMEHYGSMKPMWEAAKKITIGPPPKPNRKEYPFVGTINFRGVMIHVENKPGTYREGRGPNGKVMWRTLMKLPYGEFKGSLGTDGDKLDVYVGPYRKAQNVYIVHQNHVRGPNRGKYDEDKVMIGFDNAEQAKAAYLSHYTTDKFFRSMTVMSFPLFKRALERKEVHGEKVAHEMEKIAIDLKLEDLFNTSKIAQRRQRTWKHPDGRVTKVTGSGLGSMDMAKQASAEPQKPVEELFGKKAQVKRAEPLSPAELLKVSNDPKTASHLKWADIVKSIGPSKAVGRVSPLLSEREPSLPPELLNAMGEGGLESGLSTPSLMGMVLKPREFQRVALSSMGKCDLADKLDDADAVFKPTEGEAAPCKSLEPEMMAGGLLKKLLPFLSEKSYLGPPVKSRIIRITIVKPAQKAPDTEVDSPLLSKVSAAYNWYRREQMKLAADIPEAVRNTPSLHAAIYGMSDEDLFGKTAEPLVNPKALGMIVGAIPLTLMYSAHLRDEKLKGEKLGLIKNLIAEHPWLTTLAAGAGIRELMKSPQAQQALDEVAAAGKRVWTGGNYAAL